MKRINRLAVLETMQRQKAVYEAKLAETNPLEPDRFNRYEQLEHTIEALEWVIEQIGKL